MEVYAAINNIQNALSKSGILKAHKNAQQGYSFRGIDDVYNALAPLLAEHGLCILPRVLSRQETVRASKSGGAIFSVVVEVEFDFVSVKDGSKHVVKVFGEAMDSADKATNKALSAAYKYACIQGFAIPTEGDNDADAATVEVAATAALPTLSEIDATRNAASAAAPIPVPSAVVEKKSDEIFKVTFHPKKYNYNTDYKSWSVFDGQFYYSTKKAENGAKLKRSYDEGQSITMGYFVNGKYRNIAWVELESEAAKKATVPADDFHAEFEGDGAQS